MLYINEKTSAFNALVQNELLLRYTNETKHNIIYTWQTPQTVILGSKDTRLIDLKNGLIYLNNQNYDYILRNSGGLAVVSDEGTLNLSLIIYNLESLNIDEAYQKMVQLITNMLKPLKIIPKEIANSYCPGNFDLSIDNYKIAGLSQKRFKNAINIMAYISLSGNQHQRAQIIKNFYDISKADKTFPTINPHCMKSLKDFNYQNYNLVDNFVNNSKLLDSLDFQMWKANNTDLENKLKQSILKKQTILKEGD